MNRRGFISGVLASFALGISRAIYTPTPEPLTHAQLIERMLAALERLPKDGACFVRSIDIDRWCSRYEEMLDAQGMTYGSGPGQDALRRLYGVNWPRALDCT